MNNRCLKDSLRETLERFSDNIAMQVKKEKGWDFITYAELKNRIDKHSSFVKELGLSKGDRIALLSKNSPEWGTIFFSCVLTDMIIVPIAINSTFDEIKNIINDSGAKAIFLSTELSASAEGLKNLPALEKIIIIDENRITGVSDVRRPLTRDISVPKNLAVILYTSGTTASPKGVMLTHQNLYSNFSSVTRLGIISSKDNILSVLPLHHTYPLMITLIAPILSGARIVYPAYDWPETLTNYIKDAAITVLVGVPQMFHRIHQRITNKLRDLGLLSRLYIYTAANLSWSIRKRSGLNPARILLSKLHNTFGKQLRFFASGGAKIDKKVEEDLFRWGFTVLEGYGLTETSPVAAFNPPDKPKIGSVGIPISNVKIKIVDKDKTGVGEIAIQGPNVMSGYYHKQGQTKECIRDGWFFSGDLGYFDKEGYLYITGRSKELIILSSGKNIYPDEVEIEYSKTPFVKEICVLGIAREKGAGTQDYLYAVVVPDFEFFKERGEINIYSVIKSRFEDISKSLPGHKHIMGFVVTNRLLPRTVLGKLKRYEVEEIYIADILKRKLTPERESLSPDDEKITGSEVGKKVIGYLRQSFGIKEQVLLNNSIEIDLGVDSLGRVELISAMEGAFGIKLSESLISASIFTVKDLILKIESVMAVEAKEKIEPSDMEPIHLEELIKRPLSTEFMNKIRLKPTLLDYILAFIVRGLVYLFFKLFYKIKIEGADKIPREGPYIICVNHVSFFDGFIISVSVPFHSAMKLFFMGFRVYFVVPVVRSLVKAGRILPIDATQIVDVMQAAFFVLSNGKAICIFPEGQRSFDGRPLRFKKGVGFVAKEAKVKLIPAFIEGAFEAWPRTSRFPRPGRIKVKFGDAVDSRQMLEQGRQLGIKDDAEAISSAIRERVAALM
jgi:long-chain acyl-CoA synthetase